MPQSHYTHFSQEERCVLSAYLSDGLSQRKIAEKLQRSIGGLSLEIEKGSVGKGRDHYDPFAAQMGSRMRKWHANSRNPMKNEKLQSYVQTQLIEGWSPEIISGRLKDDYSHDPSMQVNHESIYQWAYKNGVSHLLPRGKPRRSRRRYRLKAATGTQGLGVVTSIHQRPEAANERTEFGHLESDSMLEKKVTGDILSIQLERVSRYLFITRAANKSAPETRKAIAGVLRRLPSALKQTLTFDRGTEGAEHHLLGIDTYFCDPYSSWQKGSVEQVIGLIRRYIPKGTDLSTVTDQELKTIQNRLNNRPRKVLGFKTPREVLSAYCTSLGVQLPD